MSGGPLPESRSVAPANDDTATGLRLELLYRNQRRALIRMFVRNRAPIEDAQDLAQEAFVRLASAGQTGAEIATPEAYLQRIAQNLLRNRARGALRHADALHEPYEDHDIADADETARLEARDSLRRIEAAMQRLKPRTREIYMAHRIDGLTYGQIAELTGMSVKGVEKQMAKALAALSRLMERG